MAAASFNMMDPASAFLVRAGHGIAASQPRLSCRTSARRKRVSEAGSERALAVLLGAAGALGSPRIRSPGKLRSKCHGARTQGKHRLPKVVMASTSGREAREAIRQCLRENRTMPVLQALPEDSLQQILDTMTRMELEPGTHIFRRGEPVDAVYVVESGELSVFKRLQEEDEEEIEATTLGTGSYIGELGLFYDRTCMESVCVRGNQPATVWQLCREDFFSIIDQLANTDDDPGCEVDPDQMDEEPAAIFAVSDGSGYSAGGAVTLALKQFEYRYRSNCQSVGTTTFPYIRYKPEILEITRRAREENALVVYTLMREEPREAIIEELQRPTKPGENESLGLSTLSICA